MTCEERLDLLEEVLDALVKRVEALEKPRSPEQSYRDFMERRRRRAEGEA
jgi:hypothetical protein